jgi:enoyl-CoA hydratase/carnithine racemase
MLYTQILYDVVDYVATVTLNRPDRLNAWTTTMESELRHAMESANDDPLVRVIVLTGAGRGFCAGLDMAELSDFTASGTFEPPPPSPIDGDARPDFHHPMAYFPSLRKPVIAAINGAAAGHGFVLASYCDLRFAGSSSAFITAFARRGLIAEFGMAWLLPRIVGQSRALDLLFSSRKVGADEALRIGLVDRVFTDDELLAKTASYAADMAAGCSPRSTRIMKRQVWNANFQSLEASLAESDREMAESIKSSHFQEGVSHFVEKRGPIWPDD